MKNRILLPFLFLTLFATAAFAAEPLSMEPAVIQNEKAPSDAMAVVTGSGQMMTKPGAVFSTGGDDTGMALPYLASNPKPIVYPRWAVRQGWTGKIVLAIEIFKDGNVGRYKIMQSTGYKMLDHAAVQAVQVWKFHPARKNGQAIHTCVQIPILFELRSE